MRPVNLIPPEHRRRERGPARTGVAPWAIVGALVLALAAITAVTMFGNQISEREAERDRLELEEAALTAQAQAVAPYAGFASLALARQATVTSLAQSRFDWERVMRELALVMPADVWLIKATASAGAGAAVDAADRRDHRPLADALGMWCKSRGGRRIRRRARRHRRRHPGRDLELRAARAQW